MNATVHAVGACEPPLSKRDVRRLACNRLFICLSEVKLCGGDCRTWKSSHESGATGTYTVRFRGPLVGALGSIPSTKWLAIGGSRVGWFDSNPHHLSQMNVRITEPERNGADSR